MELLITSHPTGKLKQFITKLPLSLKVNSNNSLLITSYRKLTEKLNILIA